MQDNRSVRDITVNTRSSRHGRRIVEAVEALPETRVINILDRTFLMHLGGKVEVKPNMELAAARAIAGVIPEVNLAEDYIVPSGFDERVVPAVAETVAQAAKESGVARRIGNEQETGISTPLRF
jgi:hypothetical protein